MKMQNLKNFLAQKKIQGDYEKSKTKNQRNRWRKIPAQKHVEHTNKITEEKISNLKEDLPI